MRDALDRERLIEENQTRLPEFVRACHGKEDVVIMHQDAFAPQLGSDEVFLLGKAMTYAGNDACLVALHSVKLTANSGREAEPENARHEL